jgi:hypothetical protein
LSPAASRLAVEIVPSESETAMNPDDLLPDDPLSGAAAAGGPGGDEPEEEQERAQEVGAEDTQEKTGARFVPEFVRKMAWAGLTAVFMSEEGIRRLASQLKLPKEGLSFLLAQAEKTKDDIGRVVSEEVRKFLQSERLRDELLKLLAGMTIEVKAEIKLVPDRLRNLPGALAPKVQITELKTKAGSERRRRRSEDEPK